MPATRTMTEATIYWDTQDLSNEGWAYRVKFDDGHEESGEWDGEINERESGIESAVIDLAYQHKITIPDSSCVAVDGLCGIWAE